MSASPVEPDQSNRPPAPGRTRLSQGSKQNPEWLARILALIASVLAALIIGVAIGNAVRKRIDKWAHAYS
jgi:hypothetical protein